MKKVTLLNVYGKKNIGDEAINQMALSLTKKALGKDVTICSICVDSNESSLEEIKNQIKVTSPYSYVINEGGSRLSSVEKIVRFTEMLSVSILLSLVGIFSDEILPKKGPYSYIHHICDSDIILNMGGGYLRTKNRFSDYFGLVTTLLPIFIAKIYRKPLLFLPMSFGNFASSTQKWLSFQAVRHSTFFARDNISFDSIQNYPGFESSDIDLNFSPDLALLNAYETQMTVEQKRSNKYAVLSARKWMSPELQDKFEHYLASTVDYLYEKYGLETVFIPMASNSIEDDDNQVAVEIQKLVLNKNAFSVKHVHSPQEVISVLDKAALAICTRMHSAILSSLVLTPFITIEYEHKTLGFMKLFGLERYNIRIEKASISEIKKRAEMLLMNNDEYLNVYEILKIKRVENAQFEQKILEQLNKSNE